MEYFYFDLKTNTVFTLRKNRSFIPECLTETTKRDKQTSRFLFTDLQDNLAPITSQSYITKSRKLLLLASTIHHDGRIIDDSSGLSELNNFYNITKGGVDCFDQIMSQFTCKRKTLRWPLSVFYTIIDMASINSYLIASKLGLISSTSKDSRREFLINLALELSVKKVMTRKFFDNHHLFFANQYVKEANKRLKINLEPFKLQSEISINSNQSIKPKKYCEHYRTVLNKSTNKLSPTDKFCCKCGDPTCKFHCKQLFLCFNCKSVISDVIEEHPSV